MVLSPFVAVLIMRASFRFFHDTLLNVHRNGCLRLVALLMEECELRTLTPENDPRNTLNMFMKTGKNLWRHRGIQQSGASGVVVVFLQCCCGCFSWTQDVLCCFWTSSFRFVRAHVSGAAQSHKIQPPSRRSTISQLLAQRLSQSILDMAHWFPSLPSLNGRR